MNQVRSDLPSPRWQSWVTTIRCEMIDEHVSLMAKNDWTSHCTWYKEYKGSTSEGKKIVKRDRKTKRQIELCQGPLCSYVTSFRDRLIEEERGAAS
ncbi:MAG: hypothetical protein HXY46_03105 [Syntrophaceae bacterium]|nr:hypothetical protein [Syntrophaceae bacterium]